MTRNIHIVNSEPFINSLNDLQCGKAHVACIEGKDFEIKQSDTRALEGYEFPINKVTGEKFPFCCKSHRQIFKIGMERYITFPNCCEGHKKLNTVKWFRKEDYSYLPNKLVTTIAYTWHCITKCIENPNWFKEITDYIEYTKMSYGQFPEGFGSPLGLELYLYNLEKQIEGEDEIPNKKKEKLLSFIRKYFDPVKEVEHTDLNLLIGKYKEWLKIFPFQISFLTHLKPYFERQMPIISSVGETNSYTGLTPLKLKTKQELITFLVSTTLTIIKEINTHQLFQKSALSDAKEVQVEIVLAKRKMELEELDKSGCEDRKEYIKLLKSWLNGEKRFLKEISSLFNNATGNIDFIKDLVDGVWRLQKNDTNEPCIVNVRENKPNKETSFRYWFKNFFSARYPTASVTAEEEKGSGRIDLKISHKSFGEKIIEFKGWWNQDKKNMAHQVCSYLTDFEKDGYIFMINHLEEREIIEDYKKLIATPSMGYVADSWKEHRFENTNMTYYESMHRFSVKEKTVYHFIFNVYFSSQKDKVGTKKEFKRKII